MRRILLGIGATVGLLAVLLVIQHVIAAEPEQQQGAPERPDLKKLFEQFDKDKDGKLTLEEVQAGFEELHKSRPNFHHGMPPFPPGFEAGAQAAPGTPGAGPGLNPEMIKKGFEKYDKDKDGKLTLEEVIEGFKELPPPPMMQNRWHGAQGMPGMPCMGENCAMRGQEGKKPDLKELFEKFDKDKDGKLTLEEVQAGFEELHKTMPPHAQRPCMMPGMGPCMCHCMGPMGPGMGPMGHGMGMNPPPCPGMGGMPGMQQGCCCQSSCPANKALEEKIQALEARIKVLEEKK